MRDIILNENGYYWSEQDGKVLTKISLNQYTITEVDGVYIATEIPIDLDKIKAENDKETLRKEIELARAFSGTTPGDADLVILLQDYTDLCDGIPIVTKDELKADRDAEKVLRINAEADAENYLGMIMESEVVW